MTPDPHGTPDRPAPDPDVCIVGAGPAGLTLARELLGAGITIAVVESGASTPDPAQHSLNRGHVVGSPYAGLAATRCRQVGGASAVWNTAVGDGIGAKFAPLDPMDFEGDPDRPGSDWPFGLDHLRPYYERAQRVCGLGPFAYDAVAWAAPGALLTGAELDTRVYQFGPRRRFTETYPAELRDSSEAVLHTRATARRVAIRAGRAVAVECAMADGTPLLLRPRLVVLAAGAVENARLLLCSGDSPDAAPGNQHGWVGRGFMEHPRDRSLLLRPRADGIASRLAFYDRHPAADGTTIAGRLAPTESWLRREGLPNFSVSILPRHGVRLPWRLRSGLERIGWRPAPLGYGWTATARGRPALEALIHLEQRPHRDNAVRLGAARDRFGTPLPVLHWRWRAADDALRVRARAAVRRWLEATGLFDVEIASRAIDPNAHHHAGTTRFHRDPRFGVADPDGRVHGLDNLYVAGASLFPTAGVANPTLTIVALALRLADHVRSALGATGAAGPEKSATDRRSRSR